MSLRNLIRNPLFWLVLQLLGTFLVLAATGNLQYQRHPDTASYLNLMRVENLPEALSHRRTLGYPLFLKSIIAFGRWLEPVPAVQVLLYFASILFFWLAVKRFSGSGWLAWAAVFPLPWAGVMTLSAVVLPDFLASAAALGAIACLLLLVKGPPRLFWWLGMGGAVFCAYQLRPASVFLILFIPLLALMLEWLQGERSWRKLGRWVATTALVSVTPFLAFCTWRWVTVGHFGVVAFGGLNQAGMAANFLDGRLVKELPREHRRLARNMLRMRRERGWETMTMRSATVDHFAQYSDNIWRIALPVVRQEYQRISDSPEDHPERAAAMDRPPRIVQNEMLSSASKAIVRLRPGLYFKWVRGALVYGLQQLADYVWIVGPALLILISVPIFQLTSRPLVEPSDPRVLSTLIGLLVLGVGYFSAYLLLISLVSFPFTRYFVSLTLFLPTALCVQLFAIWQRILRRPAATEA